MHAISLEGISKKYRIYPRQRDRLREILSFGKVKRSSDFWALKDVTLKIEPGVSLGLLGRNGAGKSTLLQIVSGVLQPTTGVARTNGRISALLQLGAGFNQEFTGRENALMNGLLLGIDRKEMIHRFDEIEAFADIGEFMDQPVKNYSSGMRARLGFAVAVNVEPDILLVDETLSVGDGVFRHMGIQKMRELRDSGATIIFVSHSTTMVKNFCTDAALLQKGRLIAHGDVSETIDYYQALLSNAAAQKDTQLHLSNQPLELETENEDDADTPGFKEDPTLQNRGPRLRHGTGEARIQSVEVLNAQGAPSDFIDPHSPMTVRVHVKYKADVNDSVLSITLRNKTGLDVYSTNTNLEKAPIKARHAGDRIIVDFSIQPLLRHGPYSVNAAVSHGQNKEAHMDWIDVATAFDIGRPVSRGAFAGLVHLPTQVTVFEPEHAHDSGRGPEQSA
ncbi:MAG TPA: ABC transporter ATP-binding protein [Rubrobacteraceae bacterium]|nr:ABC transporter ATP-binding protein [Rubrobacteraceae bacterium]